MAHPNCFLCQPEEGLVIARARTAYAMVGLGPITATYAILSASAHHQSLSDLAIADPAAIIEIVQFRRDLEAVRGPLLMTEHGRVPVCRDDDNQHEAHCFHAHSLLFSLNRSILSQAQTYYSGIESYSDLLSALKGAANHEAYLLLSEHSELYHVLSGPLNVPRQLTRFLAALSEGEGNLADWRANPHRIEALHMAESLRAALQERV